VDEKAPFARCRECPLVDQPFVPGNGPTQTDLVVVGQAPGDQEVERGKPFVGPAGKALRCALALVGVDASKVYFTNTVLCHPGKNERTNRDRKPPTAAIVACQERLKREREGTGARWILAVGAVAAERVTGKHVLVSTSRASLLRRPLDPDRMNGDACVGITHHPSAPFPRSTLVDDIRALLSFSCNGQTPDVYL
jgi:DNA polymerase